MSEGESEAFCSSEVTKKHLALNGPPSRIGERETAASDPPVFGTWVDKLTANDTAIGAAKCSLQSRLNAVNHFLPLASKQPDNINFVHKLRVFTRRSTAAIGVFEEFVPKRESKWLRKVLKDIRKAASNARDLDVLERRYSKKKSYEKLLKRIRKRRAKAQLPIIRIWQQLTVERSFEKRLQELWLAMETAEVVDTGFAEWSRDEMKNAAGRFFESEPNDMEDLQCLHEYRIRSKELRYTMELMAPAFPAEFRDELYPVVAKLQGMLGDINDHAVACARLGQWRKSTSNDRKSRYLQRVLKKERSKLKKSIRGFAHWWTPARSNCLKESLMEN